MKSEYGELVALEARFGADGRFTTQERTELGDRYGALTQALSEGGYGEDAQDSRSVADGRAEFERRVDAAVSARRLSRTQASALKRDYAALIQIETSYARDGLSSRERDDLDARLDALDARVGDTAYGGDPVLDNRTRLANVERALSGSGIGSRNQRRSASSSAISRGWRRLMLRHRRAVTTGLISSGVSPTSKHAHAYGASRAAPRRP